MKSHMCRRLFARVLHLKEDRKDKVLLRECERELSITAKMSAMESGHLKEAQNTLEEALKRQSCGLRRRYGYREEALVAGYYDGKKSGMLMHQHPGVTSGFSWLKAYQEWIDTELLYARVCSKRNCDPRRYRQGYCKGFDSAKKRKTLHL